MANHIVVWDPSGMLEDGTILGMQAASSKAAIGVVSLPTDTDMFREIPHGAYAKRSWGPGFPSDDLPGVHYFAPIALYGTAQHTRLSYAFRLEPVDVVNKDGIEVVQGVLGTVQFAPMTVLGGSQCSFQPKSLPLDLVRLGAPDVHGGWTVQGEATVNIGAPGFHAFSLYGAARGVRVAWLATTFSKE
jgi:hypothetical protein